MQANSMGHEDHINCLTKYSSICDLTVSETKLHKQTAHNWCQ